MKKLFILIILLMSACLYAQDRLPTLLIYNSDLGSGAKATDSRLTAKTLRFYAEKCGLFETLIYNPEHPVVILAERQGKITTEEISASAPVTAKIKVAKVLNYDYVGVSQVSREDGKFVISFTMYNLKSEEAFSESGSAGIADEEPVSNSMHSACSGIISRVINKALGINPTFGGQTEVVLTDGNDNQIAPEPSVVELSGLERKELDKLYDAAMKNGDLSEAFRVVRKAIDMQPDDPVLRLKLAEIYYARRMYKDALESYYTAINMGYRGDDLMTLKNKYEKMVRYSDTTSEGDDTNTIVIDSPVKKNEPKPAKVSSASAGLLSEADKLWLSGDKDAAIEKYNSIILSYPSDYRAYERLAMLYANSQQFIESASILKTMNTRGTTGDYKAVLRRSRTMSSIVLSALQKYTAEIKSFGYEMKRTEPGKAAVPEKLKSFRSKIDNLLIVVNQLSVMDPDTGFGNLKLIGNLLNSGASGYGDFYETRDDESLVAAEDFIEQAENKIKTNV